MSCTTMHNVSLFDILIIKGPIASHVEDDVTWPLGFLSGVFLLGGGAARIKVFWRDRILWQSIGF